MKSKVLDILTLIGMLLLLGLATVCPPLLQIALAGLGR